MKKLKLIFATFALLLGVSNAWAQTDVTSTYLTNADFSSTTGWTQEVSASYKDIGNGLIGTYAVRTDVGTAATVDDTHLVTEYCFGFEARWASSYASYNQTTSSELPEGYYTLTYDVENTNSGTTSATYNNLCYVKVGETTYSDTSTEWMNGNSSWTTHTINFTITEDNATATVSLGYGTGSNNFKHTNTPTLYVSHLKLTYISFADAYAAAVSAATTTINNATYANVIGTEKSALQTLINQDPSGFTAEQYIQGISNIETAVNTFTAAKDNYDALVTEIAKAKALGIATATADSYAATASSTAATALTSTQDLKVAEYTFVTSNYSYAVDLGAWTTVNATTRNGQHWDGTGISTYFEQANGWGDDSWSCSYSQNLSLPAGNYVFKVAGRKSFDDATLTLNVKNGETILGTVNDFPNGDTGFGINTSGATDFSSESTYAKKDDVNTGRGWQWRYVKFTLAAPTTITISIEGAATAKYNWVGFCNPTVQTDNEANIALITYNIALASANTVIASNDYTNVKGVERAALQAAIDADATLDKSDAAKIVAATTTLNNARTAFTAAKTNYDALATAITNAQAIVDAGANVGSGAFQIPTSAQTTLSGAITTATTTKESAETTSETAGTAAETLNTAITTYQATEINTPADGKVYHVILTYTGWDYDNNAITYLANDRDDHGLYNIKYQAAANVNLAQAFTFTKVSGNNYKMSQIDADGNARYICTGVPYGGNTSQIRTTTTADDALVITIIPTSTDGVYNLYNTEASQYIGSQDAGVYTVNSHINFNIVETSKPVVDITIDEYEYITRIFPFAPSLPPGVKAYSCEAEEDGVLTLVEVAEPAANVPYILYSEDGYTGDALTGWSTGYNTTYTEGWLTGVYTATDCPVGSYVLQVNDSKIGFYEVVTDKQPSVGANRCYLTSSTNARALYFRAGDVTGVKSVEAASEATLKDGKYFENGKVVIVKNGKKYNAAGAQVK